MLWTVLVCILIHYSTQPVWAATSILTMQREKKRETQASFSLTKLLNSEQSLKGSVLFDDMHPWNILTSFFFSLTRDFETVGKSHGLLSCLILGSMMLSPCQLLLFPWKPALLNWQYEVKPPPSFRGVVDTWLQPWTSISLVLSNKPLKQSEPTVLRVLDISLHGTHDLNWWRIYRTFHYLMARCSGNYFLLISGIGARKDKQRSLRTNSYSYKEVDRMFQNKRLVSLNMGDKCLLAKYLVNQWLDFIKLIK